MGRLAKKTGKLRQLLEEQHQEQQQHRAEEILCRIRHKQEHRSIRPLVETALEFTEQRDWMTQDQQWGYFYALLERAMSHDE